MWLQGVDVLVVPTTAVTAPPIPTGALTGGCSDLGQVATVMKFTLQVRGMRDGVSDCE